MLPNLKSVTKSERLNSTVMLDGSTDTTANELVGIVARYVDDDTLFIYSFFKVGGHIVTSTMNFSSRLYNKNMTINESNNP